MTDQMLIDEATALHRALSIAELEATPGYDKNGRRKGDPARAARLSRLTALAADRWRRRCGYEWRRVPEGVRASRR